ncbi:MAG: TIGR01777 family oxidoreductase [Polyangiales bacterium]
MTPRSLLPVSKVCVMGATGFLGRALCAALEQGGATVHRYSRSARPGFATWDPGSGKIDLDPLEGSDAVVNLSGEDIAASRWSAARKHALRESRVASTELLVSTLAQLERPPSVLVNASAVGYYGNRGQDAVFEHSPRGHGFLAELCQAWESATAPAAQRGVRVVIPRFGIILSAQGGALARMLPAFKLGVAGRLGDGQQFMPWISLSDAVSVIRFMIGAIDIAGPVNAVAPEATTNEDFTETLARVLKRPAFIPVPNFALKVALGELSQVLLEGANVRPQVLEEVGFRFDYPRLEDALEAMLR